MPPDPRLGPPVLTDVFVGLLQRERKPGPTISIYQALALANIDRQIAAERLDEALNEIKRLNAIPGKCSGCEHIGSGIYCGYCQGED